jgi:hypothetical protein
MLEAANPWLIVELKCDSGRPVMAGCYVWRPPLAEIPVRGGFLKT